MNKLFDNNITLDRDTHTYSLTSNPNINFISATTFVSQFFEKFEAEKIARRLVKVSPKYMNMTVQDVLQLWKDAADHGTIVHEELENNILNKTPITERKAIHGINWLNKFKMKSDFNIYLEFYIEFNSDDTNESAYDLFDKYLDSYPVPYKCGVLLLNYYQYFSMIKHLS